MSEEVPIKFDVEANKISNKNYLEHVILQPSAMAYSRDANRFFTMDKESHQIFVNSYAGEFLYNIPQIYDEGYLDGVQWVTIYKTYVIVTFLKYLKFYSLDGDLISTVSENEVNIKTEYKENGFSSLAVTEEGEMLICKSRDNKIIMYIGYGLYPEKCNFTQVKLSSPKLIKIWRGQVLIFNNASFITVLDMKGILLRKIRTQSKKFEFSRPVYFELNDEGDIFISDYYTKSVRLITSNGGEIYDLDNITPKGVGLHPLCITYVPDKRVMAVIYIGYTRHRIVYYKIK